MNTIEAKLSRAQSASISDRAAELARRFVDTALREGAADVAFATLDTQVGRLFVAVTPRGLLRTSYMMDSAEEEMIESLARRYSPRILESTRAVAMVETELAEYFEGKRKDFDLTIDWSLTSGFGRRVLQVTAAIPYGEVLTYREVADRAGSERGARAAGNALGANPIPIVVPCHRVVASGGGLGGYTGGLDKKLKLLAIEGVLDSPNDRKLPRRA